MNNGRDIRQPSEMIPPAPGNSLRSQATMDKIGVQAFFAALKVGLIVTGKTGS
jgi:hypothetical protein